MGWKLPGRLNGAEKMLEPNSHGCDLLQQLDKDKKEKKKIPDCSNQFGRDPRPACCFAIHEGLSVSNANLSLFQPRISKRHASILKKKKKNDTCRMKGSDWLFTEQQQLWKTFRRF